MYFLVNIIVNKYYFSMTKISKKKEKYSSTCFAPARWRRVLNELEKATT